jgi:hypothetical protein
MSYTTHLFGLVPGFFLSNTRSIPINIEEWTKNENMYKNGMEVIFYETLKGVKDDTLIYEYGSLDHAISYNTIKKVETYGFSNMFFFQKGIDDYVYLVIHNRSTTSTANIEFQVNGEHWQTLVLGPTTYHMNKIVLDDLRNKIIKEIVNIDDFTYVYEKNLNNKNIEILKKSHEFIPK